MVFSKPPIKRKQCTTNIPSQGIKKLKSEKDIECSETSIKVIVRVRPPNTRESQDNYKTIIKVCNSQMLVFDPKEEEDPFFYRGVVQKRRDILKKQSKNLEFTFNRIFDDTSTNRDVFEGSTRDMISSLLDGYNCSVFAYGATGAGKTHTMLGKENDPGITYCTVSELFSQIELQKDHRDFNLGVTYLEIYNENVQDLLEKKGPLFLREDGHGGVIVTGLKIISIHNAEELLNLLTRGNKNRTQFPTDANGESSRSHAVFQVYISMKNKLDGQVKTVKLSMIDLAGSERGSATGCKGDRFKEGANINKSLLALGNCINNLADGIKHIPYRDSKLTRLLKDSLGGNCQTVMIANISPSSLSYEDTYNTLKYANRAKKIKTTVKKNVIVCTFSASDYAAMLEAAKKENIALKAELHKYKNVEAPKVDTIVPASAVDNAAAEKEALLKKQSTAILEKLKDLWDKKRMLNEKILYLESSYKIMSCRINFKNAATDRLCQLKDSTKEDFTDELNSSGKKRVNKSISHFENQRKRIETEMNSAWIELQKVEQEISALNNNTDEKINDILFKDKMILQLNLEKARVQQQSEHAKKICGLLQCEVSSFSSICKTINELTQHYYNLLNANHCLTDDMKKEYRQLIKKLEGFRKIQWSDEAMLKKEENFYSMIVLDAEKLNDPLSNHASISEDGLSLQEIEKDNESCGTTNSLNNTFSLDTSRNKITKRTLTIQNSNEKDASPAKQVKRTLTNVKKSGFLDKENNKEVSKPNKKKSIEILNRLKAEKARSLQTNKFASDRTVKTTFTYVKPSKALPSSRVPW